MRAVARHREWYRVTRRFECVRRPLSRKRVAAVDPRPHDRRDGPPCRPSRHHARVDRRPNGRLARRPELRATLLAVLEIRPLAENDVDAVTSVLGLARLYQGDGVYFVAWHGNEPMGHLHLALTDPPELQ